MATLPPLSVLVTADTSDLERGMGKGVKALKGLSVAAVAASAAVVGGLSAIALQGIATGKELSTLADRASATPEAFQKMAAGAASVGIQTDKLSDILQDVNDRIGDFITTGGGEMADFFDEIAPKVGVTAEQFAKLSGPDALQLFVDSLEKANVGQKEMTFYLEAMSSDLNTMYPLLKNGGAAMAELGNQAEAAGNIISASMLQSIVDADNALQEIHNTAGALQLRLSAELAPSLESAADGLQDLLSAEAAAEAIDDLVGAFGDLAEVLLSEDFLEVAAAGLVGIVDGAAAVARGMVFLSDNTEIVTIAMGGLAIAAAALGGPIWLVAGALAAATGGAAAWSRKASTAESATYAMDNAQYVLNQTLKDYAEKAAPAASSVSIALAKNYETEARSALVAAEANIALVKSRISEVQSDEEMHPSAARTLGKAHSEELGFLTEDANAASAALDNARRTLQALSIQIATGGGADGVEVDLGDGDLPERPDRDNGGPSGATPSDLQARLDTLINGIAAERELLATWYEESQETLNEALDNELLSHAEHNQRKEELQQEHADRMAQIASAEADARFSAMDGLFGDLSSLMSSENDKLFKIGKVAAIASASIDGYKAAVSAWEKGMSIGGPSLAQAYAAGSLLKTGGLIAKIGSTSASGSSSGTSSSVGSSANTAPTATAGSVLNISVDAGATLEDFATQVGEGLQDYFDKGGKVTGINFA